MLAFAAGLLVIVVIGAQLLGSATVSVKPSRSPNVSGSATPSLIASAVQTASPGLPSSALPGGSASPRLTGTPLPGDAATALATVKTYQDDIVNGNYQAAWDMLAPEDGNRVGGTYADFVTSFTFLTHPGGLTLGSPRYTLSDETHDWASWDPTLSGRFKGDFTRAFVIRVYWNVSPFTNADWTVLLALPNDQGVWEIAYART
jgi:hypothetical protein